MIRKLVVVEFKVEEDEAIHQYKKGEGYSYFQDPETGKFYRPRETFTVTGKNLEDLFIEIENQ